MPTYEYLCSDCGELTEAVQSFTDSALTDCPACPGGSLRKRFGSVGVVFKGSGFYRTDSRNEARRKASTTPAPASAKDSPKPSDGATKEKTKPADGAKEKLKPAPATAGASA
ncbi:MAG: FmdB family zinc ribbon protein [Candidatus Nanopelagicales bacterium]|nr:zinc ribbon domain-containing protein [Candidatus Nanopelagicales bacterium]MDZ4249594.1 FmdB family zinc ribbon protein [Candidatus Nanopelagicales bacterium]